MQQADWIGALLVSHRPPPESPPFRDQARPNLNGWPQPEVDPSTADTSPAAREVAGAKTGGTQDWSQRATTTVKSVFGLGSQLAETIQADPELSQVGLVGATLLILGILLLWQWRLGLAVLVGSATLLVSYSLAMPGGRQQWLRWRERLLGLNQPLALAALGGTLATLGTYMAVSIWAEAEQRWLATGAIVQGILSLGILSLLGWEWIQRRHHQAQSLFERHLSEVASPDPFRRVLGIRRLQGILEHNQAAPDQIRLGLDFLRLALERERDPVVKEALLEALSLTGIPMMEPKCLPGSRPQP